MNERELRRLRLRALVAWTAAAIFVVLAMYGIAALGSATYP